MSCSSDPDDKLCRAQEKVREAAKKGAQMICLPELFRTQYFCQREDAALFDLAETIPGPTTEALAHIAREQQVVIIASVFERRAPGLYHNTAAILDNDGSLKGIYRKMHIPDDPLYFEKYYFSRAISASASSTRCTAESASSSAGTSGIRRLLG